MLNILYSAIHDYQCYTDCSVIISAALYNCNFVITSYLDLLLVRMDEMALEGLNGWKRDHQIITRS